MKALNTSQVQNDMKANSVIAKKLIVRTKEEEEVGA